MMTHESAQWHCFVCSKTFGRKGDLTRHKLLHAGVKRHICAICNKAFSQYSGLKTHKNVHTKVKPFVCGFNSCSASFGDPSSCARHRKETHRRVGAYRCPYPLCKSSIKRRSAFAAHLKRHDIDVTYVDIDAMAPPLLPVAVSIPNVKKESVQKSMDIDIMSQRHFEDRHLTVDQARQMYFDVNDSILHRFPYDQTSIPWTHYGSPMVDPSVLSTPPTFPISNSFSYDKFALCSSSRPDSSMNFISSYLTQPKPSFEATLPVIKTENEMMVNVPRTFDGIASSMFKRSACGSGSSYPFSHPISYDFFALPALPWV